MGVLGTVVGLLQCHGNRYPGSLYEACRDIGKAEYEEYVQRCAKLHFGLSCEDPSVRLKWTSWTSYAWGHERMNTTRMAGALRAMPASVRPQLTLLKVLLGAWSLSMHGAASQVLFHGISCLQFAAGKRSCSMTGSMEPGDLSTFQSFSSEKKTETWY